MMFVCKNETWTIFSRTTLRQLGLIKDDFAAPEKSSCEKRSAVCNCPSRTLPPPLPTEMPFPGVDENREKLELWMRNHYAASAFNTCPHQPLQEMTGKPLDIVVH